MPTNPRRAFLKTGTAGVSALVALPESAAVQSTSAAAKPAHGFFFRHAKGIEINDVEIRCAQEDARPAFVLEDVSRADFFRVSAPRAESEPVFVLNNVKDFSVNRSKSVPDSEIESTERKEL